MSYQNESKRLQRQEADTVAKQKKKPGIYDEYREAFQSPDLSDSEVEELRRPIILLAQTICEHVWDQKFY